MPLGFLSTVTEWTDHFLTRFTAKRGWLRPLQLDAYRSYGTAAKFYIKGRLLADRGIAPQTAADSRWRNFRGMVRRFNSREVAGADLVAELPDGSKHLVTTDDEGYFTLIIEPHALPEPVAYLWYPIPVTVSRLPRAFRAPAEQAQAQAPARVLVPPPTAEFGVISDLDDTVLETEATNVVKMLGRVLLSNAHSRLPFEGVAEFYQALQHGLTGRPDNPFFYVSSSPWNIYDVLEEFLALGKLPTGPLLLRDAGLRMSENIPGESVAASAHHAHKLHEIGGVLKTYPHLPFVLLGDSGQEDTNIYREVVRRFPGRIKAIYIRDVQVPARAALVGPVSEELRGEGVPMLLVPDYATAAQHAAGLGLIKAEGIAAQPAVSSEQ